MAKTIEVSGFAIPEIEDITRRDFLVGGAAALLLGGCGNYSGGGEASGGAERTIPDKYNVSVVSGASERVVSLNYSADLDACLALGVDLLAFGSAPGSPVPDMPWKRARLEETEAEVIPITDGPSFERVASFEPDLILSAYDDENVMDRLRDLCPVVYLDIQFWRQALRTAGRALYLDDEAEAIVAETEQRISRTRQNLAGRIPESLDIIYTYDESNANVFRVGREGQLGILLEEVGFPPLRESETDYGLDEISRELLPESLTSEALIVLDFGYDGEEYSSATDELIEDPLIANTPAIESGRVLRLTLEETAASFLMSALSIPTVLEGLERFPE